MEWEREQESPAIWFRLLVLAEELNRLCELIREELAHNQRRRAEWHERTEAWRTDYRLRAESSCRYGTTKHD